jgi:hypothetical protein
MYNYIQDGCSYPSSVTQKGHSLNQKLLSWRHTLIWSLEFPIKQMLYGVLNLHVSIVIGARKLAHIHVIGVYVVSDLLAVFKG